MEKPSWRFRVIFNENLTFKMIISRSSLNTSSLIKYGQENEWII